MIYFLKLKLKLNIYLFIYLQNYSSGFFEKNQNKGPLVQGF
jgi:hypothetical protein